MSRVVSGPDMYFFNTLPGNMIDDHNHEMCIVKVNTIISADSSVHFKQLWRVVKNKLSLGKNI